jgi:DNA-directed RNA polymerase specialized sigma24 family protein
VSHRGERRLFATTHWSLVLAASEGHHVEGAPEALTTLCETYWYPLYAFLRGRGHDPADAEDLTQAFFAMLLEKQVLRHADRARGRFLLAALKNFAANVYARDTATKRGGGTRFLPLDFESAEGRFILDPSSAESPERSFDRCWALTLLERAMSRLQEESVRRNRQDHFAALKPHLTGDEPQLSYAQTAALLDTSEGAIKVAVHRLRRRFRDIVREEISQTVASPDEIEDELRYLWSAVSR